MTDRTRYRILEMIPGLATWTTLVGAVVLSFTKPLWAIGVVLLLDLYWLLRVLYFVFFLTVSWRRYRRDADRDWYAELQSKQGWQRYWHVIFLPTYEEDVAVLDTTLAALAASHYDTRRFLVVLAGEERDAKNFAHVTTTLKAKYATVFGDILTTVHPKNLPDEIPGKGSNLNWSGHQVAHELSERGVADEDVIVSAFDVDTIVHPQYFAALTHTFIEHPNPYRASFQPAVLYNNNLWSSPALIRVAAFGTTFWLMTELARPERMFTFSSHSMSWKALKDVGFWEKRIVTEDSRIFLQCFLHYNGDYEVAPLYVPLSMDMVSAGGYGKSLVALYKQQRRWAWGVEHFPYMLWNFRKRPQIPFRKKLYYVWNLGEGMYTWATAPILIYLLGRLPSLATDPAVIEHSLMQNAPFVLETLLRLSAIGILAAAALSLTLLPPIPRGAPSRVYAIMLLQWLLLPVMLVLFGSLPAVDAQTRLMLGRYLGFNVTKKVRLESSPA